MRSPILKTISLAALAGCSLVGVSTQAGTVTYDFTTNPTNLVTNPIKVYQAGFANSVGDSIFWKDAGGNPGGFLAITWPLGSSTTIAVFPDIDAGKIVTAFKFECDLRIGNPQQNERAADGFSINFARSNDPVFQNDPPTAANFATSGAVETGTTTGIAISFDTWSGNMLPDGTDIEGIIVRVDNKTTLKQSMPTRNGACNDNTSLQTGPRNTPYWDTAKADGTLPDAAFLPESWTNLCWQHLSLEVDTNAQLTVVFKGRTILDHFQTTYFPSAGGIVLAGRTGGADEHTHFDNLTLTTTAVAADTVPPTMPTNLRTTLVGAYRVLLEWNPATDDSGRVGYEIEQNGTVLPGASATTNAELRNLTASTAYTFRVRATDVSGNKSDWASVTATTVADVTDPVYAAAKVYGTTADPIGGTAVDGLLADARYPDAPDRIERLNGMVMSFGEPAFGNTYGDNLGVRIAGTVTPQETGQYRFFVRSDDASQLYLNTAGAAIPAADGGSYIATETDCCDGFAEPGQANDDTTTFPTSDPISLTAGTRYGILFLVKEGGGGDWGQVAWRREGDTTPAASLSPIGSPYFQSDTVPKSDPVGAVVNITQQPQNATVMANSRVEFNVAAQTSSPYTTTALYQWLKNGAPIPGGNGTNLVIQVALQADDQAKIKARVSVPGKTVESSEATLTVTPDNVPPTIANVAQADDTFTKVRVTFPEPVTSPTATTAGNYTLNGGATVSAAALSFDRFSVTLTTSALAQGTNYTLTVDRVADNAGNPIAPSTRVNFRSWAFTTGKMKYEFWSGIGGGTVASLTSDPRYPNNPSGVQYVNSYEAPINRDDNFGAKLSGWVLPQTSGNYVFFMSSDDNGELYLSTDATPANKKLIAMEPGWNGAREWRTPGSNATGRDTTAPENRSDTFASTQWPSGATISLQAGQRYYTEILYKEGGGGDNGAATWKLAANPDPAQGSPALTGQFIGAIAPPETPAVPTIEPPTVTAGSINIKWTGGGTLEFATSLAPGTTWTSTGDSDGSYSESVGTGTKFFRVRQ